MSRPGPGLHDLAAGRPVPAEAGLVEAAIEHGMGGLLLAGAERGDVPLDRSDLMVLTAWNATVVAGQERLWSVLGSITDRLTDVGVDSYAIKGVANEARWFGRMGDRPSSDVDLVIAPHHVDRVAAVIGALAPDHPLRNEVVALVTARQLQHLDVRWDGVAVDIHFDPLKLGTWTRRPGALWDAVVPVDRPDGGRVAALDPAHALGLALLHLNKDRFAYLGSYVEVARMVTDPGLDRDVLDRFLADEGLEVALRCSLAEVVERLGLPIDAPWPGGVAARAWRSLWPRPGMLQGGDARAVHRFRQSLLPHLGLSRNREAASELRRRAIPPRALLDLHRPDLADHRYLRRVTVDRLPGGPGLRRARGEGPRR